MVKPAPPPNALPKPPAPPSILHQRPPNAPPNKHVGVPHRMDFSFQAKYSNTLPDLPFPGKFLKCNSRKTLKTRFAGYHLTQLEAGVGARRLNMCDVDPATSIDLIDPMNYYVDRKKVVKIDEKDLRLLEDESKEFQAKSRRSQQHAVAVPFMRRTEYISSDFNRLGTGADRQEIRVGYNLMKKSNVEEIFLYRDRESQIAAIEKTFEDVKKSAAEHHHKKGVYAVEECPIYPDFQLWPYLFSQVQFDAAPTCAGIPEELQNSAMLHSRLVAVNNETLGYFTPDVETLQQLLEGEEKDVEEQEYKLAMSKEYKYNIMNKTNRNLEDDYFMHKKDGHVYYRELNTNVRVMRKRINPGEKKVPCTLEVNERLPNEKETEELNAALRNLMNPYERDEEDGEEQNEEGAAEAEKGEGEAGNESDSGSSSSTSSSSSSSDTD